MNPERAIDTAAWMEAGRAAMAELQRAELQRRAAEAPASGLVLEAERGPDGVWRVPETTETDR